MRRRSVNQRFIGHGDKSFRGRNNLNDRLEVNDGPLVAPLKSSGILTSDCKYYFIYTRSTGLLRSASGLTHIPE